MTIKYAFLLPLLLCFHLVSGQEVADAWMKAQLGQITWQEAYKGVLADFHPITLVLASDQDQIAGYLIHAGDDRKHRLIGDWSKNGQFVLQERDDYDRLTGYMTGSLTSDQVQMKWMSADQSRLFDVKAFPERLIKIKNFKPSAEWIEIAGTPAMYISVQKMDYGIVSGMANLSGRYIRFDGTCLDGTCSMWNATIQTADGKILNLLMRQKDHTYYRATLDGVEYKAEIKYVTPLSVRQFDNSTGYLDFVYPQFDSKAYNAWLDERIDSLWNQGINHLNNFNASEYPIRLAYRTSGWIEIIDEGDSYVSGMITYITPDVVHREAFLWLKKEDAFVPEDELVNTPQDIQRGSTLALAATPGHDDESFQAWLHKVGYTILSPTVTGVAMATPFDMVYGDGLQLLSEDDSKTLIKRKYWKYFGW